MLVAAAGAAAQVPVRKDSVADTTRDGPPPIRREFRAVWVASVANIDWPSRRGLSTEEQQRELLAILDRAALLKLNAIILQVRPAADAFYASRYEPWSEFLTGKMGRAPEPFYDPLAFAVAEAHRRGLELHAWFNPYRARHPAETSAVVSKHVSRAQPALVRKYGPYLWLDPGDPKVRELTTRVILDVVKRYDIDGVHIDDYFYPYREPARRGRGYIPFPDNTTWRRYVRGGGKLSRDDWRRRNVDLLVQELYEGVKKTKPWVKFGVSPFGIWRPGYPASVRGLDAYDELYADSRKWIQNGWVDYFTPQLYFRTYAPQQPYTDLLAWWVEQNAKGRHLWPGLYTSRIGLRGAMWQSSEILEQIRLTREQPGATGNVHFSMEVLLQDRDSVDEQLLRDAYQQPALVPASPWLGASAPLAPSAEARVDTLAGRTIVSLRPAGKDSPWLWVVRARVAGEWLTAIVPGAERSYAIVPAEAGIAPDMVVVNAVDRVGNASIPVIADLR
jgi:uncharacterized lipoprotein YddW (UPF0748 family)